LDKLWPGRKVLAISKKESKGLLSEKTFLLTVFIQLFIATFSVFLIFGLTTFYDPGALQDFEMQSPQVGVFGNEESEFYDILVNSDIDVTYYEDFSEAYIDFYTREIDAIIEIPYEQIDGEDLIDINVYMSRSELSATLVSINLKEPLEQFEEVVREVRTQRLPGYAPLDLDIESPKDGTTIINLEFIYVALLPLLLLTPAFISGGLVIDFITEEFEKKTVGLLLVSPVSLLDIISGKVLVAVFIVPIQSLAWMILLVLNGIEINNFLSILVLVSLIATILVTIGGSISLLVKERGIAQMFYSFILILMVMISYLYVNSPLNMITRLALDSIPLIESIYWLLLYTLIAIVLLLFLINSSRKGDIADIY